MECEWRSVLGFGDARQQWALETPHEGMVKGRLKSSCCDNAIMKTCSRKIGQWQRFVLPSVSAEEVDIDHCVVLLCACRFWRPWHWQSFEKKKKSEWYNAYFEIILYRCFWQKSEQMELDSAPRPLLTRNKCRLLLLLKWRHPILNMIRIYDHIVIKVLSCWVLVTNKKKVLRPVIQITLSLEHFILQQNCLRQYHLLVVASGPRNDKQPKHLCQPTSAGRYQSTKWRRPQE